MLTEFSIRAVRDVFSTTCTGRSQALISINRFFSRLTEGVLRGRNGALLDFLKSRSFPATERFLGGETVRYRDLAKTGLFPTTERVLPPIPDNTDNGVPVYGAQVLGAGKHHYKRGDF